MGNQRKIKSVKQEAQKQKDMQLLLLIGTNMQLQEI